MKIALVSPTPLPPSYGGMDRLLEGLCSALRERHPTDLITLGVDERSREGVLRGYHDFYHLDLSAYDRVITYKAPAYMIRHPRQVCYLSHRLRVFYDLWQAADDEHERMRRLIQFLDGWALAKERIPRLFTVGETVSRRLRSFGGIESVSIHHPTTFEATEPRAGEYFLSVGRLHEWKRIDLIIRAFKRSGADCPLKIVGEGPDEAALRELAGDDPRIEFLGFVDEGELAELYAGALTTVFPPADEDMGLITFESFLSGKPILTVSDSGEPAMIVEPGKTGWVTAPEPEALGERMGAIWKARSELEAMAEHCLDFMKEVTWNRLVDALLGEDSQSARASAAKAAGNSTEADGEPPETNGAFAPAIIQPAGDRADGKYRLLVTDNQIIDPPVGGGRVRILELYRHMPDDFTTTYIGAFDYPGPGPRDQQLAPNFREILTPLTARHFKLHHLFGRLTRGQATVDVTMPLLGGYTPRYRRLIDEHIGTADLLVYAHPWMFPFLPSDPGVARVYDSQNCETKLKGTLLRGTMAGRYLSRKVAEVEREAVDVSDLVLTCSEDDARSFQELFGADPGKTFVAANGVDCERIRPPREEQRREARARLGLGDEAFVIFTGSNYAPNLEGARYIVDRLALELPDVQFGMVGGVGPMLTEERNASDLPANVRLFGFVESDVLRDIYRAADVAINPMSRGSGTNIKMLDYMAAGLPIITTSVGARGIEGQSERHWIEMGLEEMPLALRSLLDKSETGEDLGRNARALAESRYDWSAIASATADRFRELIESRRAAAAHL